MKYTVGKYVIVPEKPFSSMDKAVQYIQGAYPELDKETIDKYLYPKIKEDGDNKSTNSIEKGEASQDVDSKNSTTGSKGIKSSVNKPG
ncbi:hypothetical protein EG359_17455 [Chryseobacterium joostei]|uniref:Uncharacterized protein n=1 Tax=Chryseobacterium joostei TaxID=112234 RepID=A0A1N7IB74_9FLAO|nr:hypothetical protein [Chryseobacterium joostei]AZB01291.1 hypothetical protein EG359_17455 [Chryseobacterium joostei]SIS34303.1 hypothetical protein SAMN05421768_103692 [Chryseobacterium joostei]